MTNSRNIPPSPLRRFQFAGGQIDVLARYAKFVPGDPDRLFLFAAREVEARGVELIPPSEHGDDSPWTEMRAYFVGNEENVIVYFLENWGDDAVIGFAECYAVTELHELTHWAVPLEDNEQEPDHWERWNSVLRDAVGYVMGVDKFEYAAYEPPEPPQADKTESECKQATLEDVMTS